MKESLQEEQFMLKMQKVFLQKQLEDQKKEQEFRDKLEEKYQHHMDELIRNQHKIDKKNNERIKKIEKRRMNQKKEMIKQQIKRDKNFQKAQLIKDEIINEKFNKYYEHQENIFKLRQEQKMKKENEIREMQLKRAEKERKNLEMKNKNEQMMEAKRQLLINELKQNDEKVEKYKQLSMKHFMNKLMKKREKHMEKEEKIEENQLKLQFQKYLKLKGIEDKHKKAENLIKLRDELAYNKLKLEDQIKTKKANLLAKANKLLASRPYVNKEEIYKQVFSKDDMDILNLCESTSQKRCFGNSTTKNFRYNKNNYDFIRPVSFDHKNGHSFTDKLYRNSSCKNYSKGFAHRNKGMLSKNKSDSCKNLMPQFNFYKTNRHNGSSIDSSFKKYSIEKKM